MAVLPDELARGVVALTVLVVTWFMRKPKGYDRTAQRTSALTGAMYYEELIHGHDTTFHDEARMDKSCFKKLVRLLTNKGGLRGSRGWCYLQDREVIIAPGEKVFFFIHALCGQNMRKIAQRWQHSTSTCDTAVHAVAAAILLCKDDFYRTPLPGDVSHGRIAGDDKYREFEGCIGALDGTHIHAVVPTAMQGAFRNRKQQVTQNVLGVCDFDMLFTYVLAGWEGSAHDGKVLQDAAGKGLTLHEGQYYLGDAGYALSKWVLTPYRGVRYHLKEWARGTNRPQTKEELFNLRHASLRNVVERIYGVVKKRFPILVTMSGYRDFSFQVDLVRCALMLHNFIRRNQHYEDTFDLEVDAEPAPDEQGNDAPLNVGGGQNAAEKARLSQWRDGIAQRMWDQYQNYVRQHRL